MNAFLAIILALTVKVDLYKPTTLYNADVEMQPNAQLITNLYVNKDKPVQLNAKDMGRGDINCYLLRENDNGEGWVVAAADESNLDQCSLTYTPTLAQPLRLWIKNDGTHPTNYTAVVKQ